MRATVKPDPLLLSAGVVIALLGLAVLLDSSGAITISPGWIAIGLTGLSGGFLLLSGLASSSSAGHD